MKSKPRDKLKQRVKALSKTTDGNKPEFIVKNVTPNPRNEVKKDKFLNNEETENLQDMINFVASLNENTDDVNKKAEGTKENPYEYSVESLYSIVQNQNLNGLNSNENIKASINEILDK